MIRELTAATMFHALVVLFVLAIAVSTNDNGTYGGGFTITTGAWVMFIVSIALTTLLLRITRRPALRATAALRGRPMARMATIVGGTILAVGLVFFLPFSLDEPLVATLALLTGTSLAAVAGGLASVLCGLMPGGRHPNP